MTFLYSNTLAIFQFKSWNLESSHSSRRGSLWEARDDHSDLCLEIKVSWLSVLSVADSYDVQRGELCSIL